MRFPRLGALCAALCVAYACSYDWDGFDPRLEPTTTSSSQTAGAGGSGGAATSSSASGGAGGSGASGGAGGSGGMPMPVSVTLGERSGADIGGVTSDGYVDLLEPTFNYGASDYAWADGDTEHAVTLLRFDVSALPSGATIQTAQLRMVTTTESGADSVNALMLYPLLEAWDEGSQDGAAGIANYTERTTGDAWTAMGVGPGSHDDMQLVGTVMPPIDLDTEYTVSLPASLIQGWLDDEASNFGLALMIDIAQDDGSQWVTGEGADGKQPQLELTYLP